MKEKFAYIFVDYTKPTDSVLLLRTRVANEGYEIAFKL